jgi:molybdopterin/thiamine biosynthesis adenylyltransferase
MRSIIVKGGKVQGRIPGFDQAALSAATVLCIGAGGLISHIAPTLARKGVGRLILLDRDIVESSNLNRQRFYPGDIGKNKAVALARNLKHECITGTEIVGHGLRIEDAIEEGIHLSCDVAICGVDNNPGRVAASRFFRAKGIPVIFTAVSADADHGYVFIQERNGPCIACVFPDMSDDNRYACPGTPAIANVVQVIGGLAVYAVDTVLMPRPRGWNYRRVSLADGSLDGYALVPAREGCHLFGPIQRITTGRDRPQCVKARRTKKKKTIARGVASGLGK